MSVGTVGFVADRLRQAREARGLTLVALADLVDLSSASISHYEKGEHTPRADALQKLARALNVPVSFLLKEKSVSVQANVFYRSMSAATKQARSRAERRYEWLKEIVDYLQRYVEFPALNLPAYDPPDDFREITNLEIESLAEYTRDYWRLGSGPIVDLVRTLESNGMIVSRGRLGGEHLDAFSEYDPIQDRPYIFLGSDKGVMVRSRFDAGHELFHVLAHRKVNRSALRKASDFKVLETQAHRFALALLLPGKSFTDELWDVSLDSFRSMKARWKTAIAAMIFRAEQLELIDEEGAKRLRINLSRRGWRRGEPLDDLPAEQPTMIARSIEMIVNEQVAKPSQILEDLCIPSHDVEELAGLPQGYFGNYEDPEGPNLKKPSNVVSFRR